MTRGYFNEPTNEPTNERTVYRNTPTTNAVNDFWWTYDGPHRKYKTNPMVDRGCKTGGVRVDGIIGQF